MPLRRSPGAERGKHPCRPSHVAPKCVHFILCPPSQIVLGTKLGSGEYSNVFEVKSFKLNPQFKGTNPLKVEEMEQRIHLQTHEKYRDTNKARYALKQIKDKYYDNHEPDEYVQAARYVDVCPLPFLTTFFVCIHNCQWPASRAAI